MSCKNCAFYIAGGKCANKSKISNQDLRSTSTQTSENSKCDLYIKSRP